MTRWTGGHRGGILVPPESSGSARPRRKLQQAIVAVLG